MSQKREKNKKKFQYKSRLSDLKKIKTKKDLLRRIIKWDNPILRQKCNEVSALSLETKELVEELKEVIKATKNGIGLSAPQIGYSKRVFIIKYSNGDIEEFLNSEILEKSEETIVFKEGCLSYPGFYYKIERPKKIKVRYEKLTGEVLEQELTDMNSVTFLHEHDHTLGICLVGDKWKKNKQNILLN